MGRCFVKADVGVWSTAPPAECSPCAAVDALPAVVVKPQDEPPYLGLSVPISQMSQASSLKEVSEPGTAPNRLAGEPVCFILTLSDLGSGLTFCSPPAIEIRIEAGGGGAVLG